MVRGVHGHDRGLVEDDAFAAHEDEGVGGAEVDGEIAREHAADEVEQHHCSLRKIGPARYRANDEPRRFSRETPDFTRFADSTPRHTACPLTAFDVRV